MDMQSTQTPPLSGGRAAPKKAKKRGLPPFLVRQFHTWHWMSSAICLVGMLLFAVTGITLNHAASIEGNPVVKTEEHVLPEKLLPLLEAGPKGDKAAAPVPAPVAQWLEKELGIGLSGRKPEWNEDELYIPLPKPGGDAWVSVDRLSGDVTYENTNRGWIAYLNDLHKGRNTGGAWSWFIDIFAAACIVFSLTGFLLLQLHAKRRPSTWPIVGAGVIIPLLLLIFLMH